MPFLQQANSVVPPEGDKNAKIALIGQAPGVNEVMDGKPFTGAAGSVLNNCLHAAALQRFECYITNLSKRRLPGNNGALLATPKGLTELGRTCQKELVQELQQCGANVLVPLGNEALMALTGHAAITKYRGSILETKPGLFPSPRKVIPTLHPATVIYGNTHAKRFIVSDLVKIKRHAEFQELRLPKRSLIVDMSFSEAMGWLRYFRSQHLVSFDIEVVNHEVACIAFSSDPELSVSIPFFHREWTESQESQLLIAVGEILSDSTKVFVGQNLIFDISFLALRSKIKTFFNPKTLIDTMVAHHIMYPDFPKGLDFLTSIYTDEPYYKDEGKDWKAPKDHRKFRQYNAKDSAVTLEIALEVYPMVLRPEFRDTYEFTIRLYNPLLYMMTRGVRVDSEALEIEKQRVSKEIVAKQAELNRLAGEELNVNSPKQCQNYFYVKKGIPPYTNKGRITTDDKAMQRLARGTSSRAPLPEASLVQELRSLMKLSGTYLEFEIDKDGRARCSYNPRGTATGRISSSKTVLGTGMNMQNLPPAFKNFLVVDPGYIMVELDKRQAEWVVVAYTSGDANMIKVIEEELDPHAYTGSLMTGIPVEMIKLEDKVIGHTTNPVEVAKARKTLPQEIQVALQMSTILPRSMSVRQCGKKSNHGLNYGEGYRQFSLINEIPENEAADIVNGYLRAYPGVPAYWAAVQRQLRADRTLINAAPFRRVRRFLGELNDKTFKAAYAQIPQSTVSDVVNNGLILVSEDDRDFMRPVELLAQVHDSILFQYPIERASDLPLVIQTIKEYLEPELEIHGRSFGIKTDMKIGNCWGTLEEVSLTSSSEEILKVVEKYNS